MKYKDSQLRKDSGTSCAAAVAAAAAVVVADDADDGMRLQHSQSQQHAKR